MNTKKQTKEINLLPTYQIQTWIKFSPCQRLRRSWALRKRIKNLKEIHDKKIFPSP
jgi:hypothetical protein